MGEGGEAHSAAEADADVSAVGTLVWVRRPNGSWWPGRVVSPHEVPDDCPAPTTRSPATPILLLGRRDGPGFVDWCNLDRCKRVKPFRCGELGLEDCIRRAEEQAARRRSCRRDQRVCATGGAVSRYARKEDAVLQALDFERARLRLRSSRPASTAKPSHATYAQPSSCPSTRKRRTPNDSEDDGPQRMKDLTDIGAAPKQSNAAAAFADLNRHLPSTSQMKRSKQSHHDSPKRKQRPSADQDQPCGVSRKRDRSRPLSELCNGDMWKNRFTPNGQRTGSGLDTVLDKSSSNRVGPVKTEPVDDGFPSVDDGPVDAHLAARSIFKSDHLHVHQPCASTKAPTLECTKQTPNCSKDSISSQCESRNSKKKTTSSVDHEGSSKTKSALECEHHKEGATKHKEPSNKVILLEKKVEKSTADKTAAPDEYKDLAVIPNGLDCVGAVLQQHSESKCKHEEPSETVSNHSNCENVSAPSVVFELPHQVSPPHHRDPAVARCHAAVKPVKTLQLNSSLYDVEISAQGANSSSSSKGGRVPLVSLMSRSNRRPVVGYPVSVEVLDAAPCPPAPSIDDDHPSTSNNANRLPKEEEATTAPQRTMLSSSHRAGRVKAKSRRKASEDESWRPHTKNSNQAAAVASPRKMRRLSSFAPSQRGGGGLDRRSVVGEFCHGPAVACIPLRLVFSRIHEALSYSVK